MAEGFSEHRCKKKYKSKRRNYPVVRVFLLCLFFFLFIKLGFAEKLVNMLPLPENEKVVVNDWKAKCESMRGTPFELNGGLGQCSWVVSDSVFFLPNDFLRYVASQAKTPHAKLHWIAPREDFSSAVLVQREDSLVYTYLHVMGQDSLFYWVSIDNGCRYPGIFDTVKQYVKIEDFGGGLTAQAAGVIYDQMEKKGRVDEASVLGFFPDAQDQSQIAGIFHTLDQASSDRDREKAVRETLIKVFSASGTGTGLDEVIRRKRQEKELRSIRIPL